MATNNGRADAYRKLKLPAPPEETSPWLSDVLLIIATGVKNIEEGGCHRGKEYDVLKNKVDHLYSEDLTRSAVSGWFQQKGSILRGVVMSIGSGAGVIWGIYGIVLLIKALS